MTKLLVRFEGGEREFAATFRIGRHDGCDLVLHDDLVSRQHAELTLAGGRWTLRDLNSTNGTFVNGQRITELAIEQPTRLRLGDDGPVLTLEPRAAGIEKYFRDDLPAGEHTILVREAIQQVQQKQKRRYGAWIGAAAAIALAAAGYAWYIHHQTKDQFQLARDLFYGMKTLDVEIAQLERMLEGNPNAEARIRAARERRRQMNQNYDRFLEAIRARDARLTPQQRTIVRVARIFGECELDLPKGFTEEVESYIRLWQSTGRYAANVRRAVENQYVNAIRKEFLAHDLPPQFFYLAMQESNFDPYISGPMTHYGIAKGMWQFIPKTGAAYGLKLGPLAEFPRPDPADDRHNWPRATQAAARYIKDLYATEAQASGLLVMACYNWGEAQVLPLVQSMPNNPRDRNFWRLLALHKDRLPKETYDYVFYIVSAAAIGEDPRLFGFPFDNPLTT